MEADVLLARFKVASSPDERAELRLAAFKLAIKNPDVWSDDDWSLLTPDPGIAETRLWKVQQEIRKEGSYSCEVARFEDGQLWLTPDAGPEWSFFITQCLVHAPAIWFETFNVLYPGELAYVNGCVVPNLQPFIESCLEKLPEEPQRDLLRARDTAGRGVQSLVAGLARLFRRS